MQPCPAALPPPFTKDLDGVLNEVRAVYAGGANGSIIGRNTFQRPKAEALDMLGRIIKIYQGKD